MIFIKVIRELAYYRALLTHPQTPGISRLLLAGAIACFVSPIDLIPDFIPVFGQLAWGELLVMEHVIAVPVQPEQAPPELIMGRGLMSQGQLVSFFMEQNPDADEQKVTRLAAIYIEESAFEGVNADVAFVQMCLETGFLRFGGLVTENMNNFCGLGAVSVKCCINSSLYAICPASHKGRAEQSVSEPWQPQGLRLRFEPSEPTL